MNYKPLRALLAVVSLCALTHAVHAQQRGGLDSLSLIQPGGAGADAAWQLFAPEGAGFSLLVPGTPEEMTRRGREAGTLAPQFRSYHLTAADGLKYEFGRTGQLPAQVTGQPGFNDKFWATNAQGLMLALQSENRAAKFELVAERKVSVAGYEGREYEFAAPGLRSLARVYLINRAIFAL
ncbi:MAG TPA: hypothetical protein VE775_01725, partial [Pyrinomonadaceae bacterium]|nr:hypothetical protein [Pyrinomonadaceae bacterium]